MTRYRSLLLASLCGLALVGAGCGDDDEDNQALSYDEATAEVNDICKSTENIGEGLTGDPQNDAPILADAAPQFEDAIQDMRELDVPEELTEARDDLVANGEEQLELIEKAQQHAEEGDRKAYMQTLRQGQKLDAESNEAANLLGAEECVN